MADFRSYQDVEQNRQRLLLGVAAGAAGVLAVPSLRRGIARMAVRAVQATSPKLARFAVPHGIEGTTAEIEGLFRSALPNAARSSVRIQTAGLLLERRFSRTVSTEHARRFREQLIQTGAFRSYVGRGARDVQSLMEDADVKSVLDEFVRRASQQTGIDPADIRKSELGRVQRIFRRAGADIDLSANPAFQKAHAELTRMTGEELARMAGQKSPLGRLANLFGITPVTLSDPAVAGELKHVTAALTARGVDPGVVGNLAVGGVFKVGSETVDLRGLIGLGQKAGSFLRNEFQVPLAPGLGGISPFQLFPWMRGITPRTAAHVPRFAKDAALRAHLGATTDEIGQDIFKIGRRWLGADFDTGNVRELSIRGELQSGLWGFGKKRAADLEGARAAGPARSVRDWLFGNPLAPDTQLGEAASIATKFKDPTWAPRLFQRLLTSDPADLSAGDLKRAGNFLMKPGLSPKVRAALVREARKRNLFAPEYADLIGNLESDQAVRQFFDRSAAQASAGKSVPFASAQFQELLAQYRNSPQSVLGRFEPAVDRELLTANLLGRARDRTGIDLMRGAIADEIAGRLELATGQGMTDLIRGLSGLGGAERAEALAYGHGRELLSRYYSGHGKLGGPLAWLRGDARAQAEIEAAVARRVKPWQSYTVPDDENLQTAQLFVQQRFSFLAEMNRGLKEGRGFFGSLKDTLTGGFTRQYTAYFTGAQKDVTTDTLALEYLFGRRVHNMLAEVGLGLPERDLTSGWNILQNLLLKRVAPAVGLYEGYRYLDYKGQQLLGFGPSDAYANLRAHAGMARARLTGDRLPFLGRRELYPGLEKIIPDRNPEEEFEHQQSGFDPVRKGRFWAIGGRGEFWGEKVDYFLPSAVRTARSDWQSTANVQLNNRAYWENSFLPLPENFFLGPLNPFRNPYWWEDSLATGPNAERPALQSGPMFDPQTVHGPLANATIGRIFKPRVLYRPELVPESLGGTASREELRQINLAMKAGLDERGLGLIVGGSGGGGGFPGNSSGLSAPGVLGGGGGPGGGIGQITAAGRIVVHSLPMTMDEEGYETLGKSSIQRPGWGARLSQNEIAQQNRMTKAGVGGLIKARPTDLTRLASQTTPFSEDDLDMISMESGTIQALSNATDIAGLYGFFGRTALEMAGIPLEQPGLVLQDPGRAYGFARRWYDASLGGLGGSVNEAGRRFLTRPDRNETWNPIYNTAMPSWLPGSNYFLDLRHGDIHQKIQRGELRLPGAAWESVNPQARFMWSRASSLGQSVEEHMRDMLFLDEPMSAAGERITELGSKVHSKIQAQWKKMGVLIRAEQTITNEELGISGHFDALLRTSTGEQIFEIKTVSGRRFEQASRQPFLEHLTQTNFYLHEMGLRRGNLIYVNRDDPDQIRTHRVLYDPKLYEESIGRVQEARARLGGMIDAGLISKYETLDPVSRFEILGDVASYSAEYAQVRQYLTEKNKDGQLSEAENDRFQAVKKRAAKTKKRVETFGYRFADVDLQYETVTVDQILDPNTFTIRGSENPIRLAGVRSSQDRIQDQWGAAPDGMSEAEWQFAQLGIRKGSRVRVAVEGDDKFHIADDVLKTRHAVVFARGRNVNRRLLDLGVGEEKETDFSSTGVAARFSPWEIFKGAVWERFAHANTALHTKFLRVRSPLEQLERGIVYGKDTGGWQHPVQDYLIPTIESYAAKNPVVGGALLGAFATFFVESRAVKWQAFKAGAAVGAGLSLLRMGWEATHEGPWKPVRTRRREELEEYWDTLKYLKFRRLAAQEERLAKELEGIDVDLMEREAWRQGESRSKKKNILEDYKRRLKKGDRKFDREMRELRERRAAARERRPGETEGERRARARELREEMHRLRAIRGGGPEAEAARDVQVDLIQAQLNQADEREEAVRLGPHAAKALQYRDLYRSTLHGFDPDKTPFLNLFRALPKYKRELIEPFINKSNQQEREKIFSLLPRAEQRVLGRYLGIEADRIPERPRLGEFFKDHPLPGPDWQGWEESTNLEELRQIAVKKEGLDPFESAIYPQQIEEAERRHEGVPIPTLQGRSPDIQQRLNEILSGKGLNHVRVEVAVQPRPDDGDHVQVQMQLRQRRERDILEHLQLAG